jgi:hypothetical protein
MRPNPVLVFVALGAVAVSLFVAGCGGGASPSVASLGGGTTTTSGGSSDSAGGQGSQSGGGPGQGQGMMIGGDNSLEFSRCMRAHGVSNFPDPNSQGELQIGPGSGIDPSSATFRSAMQACRKKVGGGRTPSPAEVAKIRREALAFSACMRRHGVHDFPDPTFSGGGIGIQLAGSDLNPNSPTFKAAQQACQGILSFKTHSTGSGGAK